MSNPNEFHEGVKVKHKNGMFGIVVSPTRPLKSTTLVTVYDGS